MLESKYVTHGSWFWLPTWGAAFVVVLVGCSTSTDVGDGQAATDAGEGIAGATAEPCVAPPGFTTAPDSILQVVLLLNAMSKPVTLPCFLEVLPRPLAIHASRSVFSAQPATGTRSPRIFLFSGPLIMSVVPEGTGSQLLEFGELRSEKRSLKAEIEFPVVRNLENREPFEKVAFNTDITTCAFCHAAEEQAPEIAFTRAFVSQALRPRAGERISAASLHAEQAMCDASQEPERCALLAAVFALGDVAERDFPPAMDTFF